MGTKAYYTIISIMNLLIPNPSPPENNLFKLRLNRIFHQPFTQRAHSGREQEQERTHEKERDGFTNL